MFWLTWRQHRAPVLLTGGLLLLLGVILAIHGIAAAGIAQDAAAAGCPGPAPDCAAFERELASRHRQLFQVVSWLPAAPALIGAFWGAPLLAREFERGTHKLIWTQSVTRRRWLAVKLGMLAGIALLGGLAVGGMVTAWLSAFGGYAEQRAFADSGLFATTGVVPAMSWVFALTLGVAAGALARRTVPAMAAVVAVFVIAMFGVFAARPYYAAPQRAVQQVAGVSALPASGMLREDRWLDTTGREVSRESMTVAVAEPCRAVSASIKYYDCVFEQGFREVAYFHPPGSYWRFQWTEAGLLALGTLLLMALTALVTFRRKT
jgi:hypothetical protein